MKSLFQRFRRNKSGVAMLEFAFSLPIVLPIGMYAIEMSNYALTQLKLSQLSLELADNASRVGIDSSLSQQVLREVDVDDVIQGLRIQSGGLSITKTGRITLSSLEVTSWGGQYIHWQRCAGLKSGAGYDSSYGQTGKGSSIFDLFFGMGDAPNLVTAPPGSAVMFVEINYDYQPLVPTFFIGSTKMHTTASLIVRDNRDLSQGVSNPSPAATQMTCDKYTL